VGDGRGIVAKTLALRSEGAVRTGIRRSALKIPKWIATDSLSGRSFWIGRITSNLNLLFTTCRRIHILAVLITSALAQNQTLTCNPSSATAAASPQNMWAPTSTKQEIQVGGDPAAPKSPPAQGVGSNPFWYFQLAPANAFANCALASPGKGFTNNNPTIAYNVNTGVLTMSITGNVTGPEVVAPHFKCTVTCSTGVTLRVTSRAPANGTAYATTHSLLGGVTCNATGTITSWATVVC